MAFYRFACTHIKYTKIFFNLTCDKIFKSREVAIFTLIQELVISHGVIFFIKFVNAFLSRNSSNTAMYEETV